MKNKENIKLILQEIIITVLIAIACILVLGVVFYSDMGANKNVPSELAYETPENIQAELDEIAQIRQAEKLNIVYSVDGLELSRYQKIQSYNPGKKDPFSKYKVATGNEEDGNNTSTDNAGTSGNSSMDNSIEKYKNAGYNITVVDENNINKSEGTGKNTTNANYKDTSTK